MIFAFVAYYTKKETEKQKNMRLDNRKDVPLCHKISVYITKNIELWK